MSINVVIRTKLKSVFNQHMMVKTAMSITGIYGIVCVILHGKVLLPRPMMSTKNL